ncbi:HAMP domain-containing histidine kinase [bacterium]|nr:HAMP domain-containing histidine kinase [bacterium]
MLKWLKKIISTADDYRISYHRVSPILVIVMFLVTVAILLVIFWFTQVVRERMSRYNRRIMNTYARLWSLTLSRSIEGPELSILFEEVIQKSDFPMVYTTVDGEPVYWKNLSVASGDTSQAAREKVKRWLERKGKKFPPVPVRIPGTRRVLAYIYFGESPVVGWLQFIPIAQAFVMILLFIIAMIVYRRIRRYEQQNIWLGMAKEAAHQLGTPTSSLLGWLQMMRESLRERDFEELNRIADEMERDIQILSRIVVRFGQVGSIPELSPIEPTEFVREVVEYLRQRIPQLSRNIELVEHYEATSMMLGNKLLLSWALENLIKNSVEAIGNDGGTIWVATRQSLDGEYVHLIVTDTGKGISSSDQKKIFAPGFTTKKRGWGLGLSLARRIIEDYHHGRLFLLESRPHEKTTFIIALPAVKK